MKSFATFLRLHTRTACVLAQQLTDSELVAVIELRRSNTLSSDAEIQGLHESCERVGEQKQGATQGGGAWAVVRSLFKSRMDPPLTPQCCDQQHSS